MPTEKFYEDLKGALLGGFNVKKDGSKRAWGMVYLTGDSMTNYNGETMFKGMETTAPGHMSADKERWVNIATFTGVLYVKARDYRTYYHAGKKVAKGLADEVAKSATPEVQEALQSFILADEPTIKQRLQFIGLPVPEGI
jgi:hypothetical protein